MVGGTRWEEEKGGFPGQGGAGGMKEGEKGFSGTCTLSDLCIY